MKKQELIQKHLDAPYKVGEVVTVMGLGRQDKNAWGNNARIEQMDADGVFIKEYNGLRHIPFAQIKKDCDFIGHNPFPNRKDNLRIVAYGLESILHNTDTSIDFKYEIKGKNVRHANANPFVLDKDGKIQYYQRPYCWTLEQKQLLIESIYERINCGLVIVRRRSWQEMESMVEKGLDCGFIDIVDGKQRTNAVHEFINDKFADLSGIYFSDFSTVAQRKFMQEQCFMYGELPENTSDAEVIYQFLKTNFTGVPQSMEHINFVKSIKI